MARSEAEQDKLDREEKAWRKRRQERREKKLKNIVLSKSAKKDLSRAKEETGARAKRVVGNKVTGFYKNYDFGPDKVTDIVRNVGEVQKFERMLKFQEMDRQERKKRNK